MLPVPLMRAVVDDMTRQPLPATLALLRPLSVATEPPAALPKCVAAEGTECRLELRRRVLPSPLQHKSEPSILEARETVWLHPGALRSGASQHRQCARSRADAGRKSSSKRSER